MGLLTVTKGMKSGTGDCCTPDRNLEKIIEGIRKNKPMLNSKNKGSSLKNNNSPRPYSDSQIYSSKYPVMGTMALQQKTKSLNSNVGELVQDLILDKYRSTLSYFIDRSLARRKNRKRKCTDSLFGSDGSFHGTEAESESEFVFETYDELKFLEAALGNELNNYPSTLEFLEENEDSVSTSNISELLSGTLNSVETTTFKSSCMTYSSTPLPQISKGHIPFDSFSERDGLMERLIVQDQTIRQVSKVINFCKNTKRFQCSEEYVEAEKILLLAVVKKEMLELEMKAPLDMNITSSYSKITGFVRISGLSFPSKLFASIPKAKKEYLHKYFCILTCGKKILSTKVVEQSEDGEIRFDENFFFDNLDEEFEISVKLYSLIIKNPSKTYSHEVKYEIEDTVTCPTAGSFFMAPKRPNKCSSSNLPTVPSFIQWGSLTIQLSDLNGKVCFFVASATSKSNQLLGVAKIDVESGVNSVFDQFVFLNMGVKSTNDTISWNRLWCRLEDHYLKFFSYPSDNNEDCMYKIDLAECVNGPISPASREICSKPKTLLLQTRRIQYVYKSTYLLSFDSFSDMEHWKMIINSVIRWYKRESTY